MEIRNVTSIFFSPTGSTRRLVSMLSKTFPSKPREVDITPYTQRGLSMDFGPDDLVLFGVPVYGGRIPSPAVQTLRRMQGSRTPAVLVAAYGNREYDDALLELKDLAEALGFVRRASPPTRASWRPGRCSASPPDGPTHRMRKKSKRSAHSYGKSCPHPRRSLQFP